GEPNCLLECNKDIQTLLLVNNLISNPAVDVYIHAKNEMFVVPTSSMSYVCLSETTSKCGSHGPHHYATNEWQSYISYEGQSYEDGAVKFRRKLTQYSIEVGFVFKYTIHIFLSLEDIPVLFLVVVLKMQIMRFFLCYSIVDIENEDNWTQFVKHLA
ncbi:hypothetical protein DVH24_005192, partial [Malus domestica]